MSRKKRRRRSTTPKRRQGTAAPPSTTGPPSKSRTGAPPDLARETKTSYAGDRFASGKPHQLAARSPRDSQVLETLAGEVALRTVDAEHQHRLRRQIHEQMLLTSRTLDGPNFRKVSGDDVARLIRLYDDHFFAGRVLAAASAEGVSFQLSSRMTSVGGKLVTQYPDGDHNGRRHFQLVLSSTLLFQTFEDVSRPVKVAGCLCHDRLEAMQRVAEHEFVHLIEMLIWNDGNCNESRFQSIAHRYFGHTDYQHNLITQRERAAVKFNIRVGDT